MENEDLKCRVDHLKAQLATMTRNFENAKEDNFQTYQHLKRFEANNTRLRHALRLCQQGREVYEFLLECQRILDPTRHHSLAYPSYFPSFNFGTTTHSLGGQELGGSASSSRSSLPGRKQLLLSQLEANPELQSYLPYGKVTSRGANIEVGGGEGSGVEELHWPTITLSQSTSATSGYGSMSGGMDVEITPRDLARLRLHEISPSDLERLELYGQALFHYENHLVSTMVSVDGLSGLATVKAEERVVDCLSAEGVGEGRTGGGRHPNMEDAAHVEELCRIKEEKAELKVCMYLRMNIHYVCMYIHA